MTTALLLLTSCNHVLINDAQFCSPIPGGLGAVCDNFLTSNQLILNADEWASLQQTWVDDGQAVECTTSKTYADFKAEIEKLCSMTPCDYKTKKILVDALRKLQIIGEISKSTVNL